MKAQGFDPADHVGADDRGRLLDDDSTVDVHAVEPRIDPPPGTPYIADVVLRARRCSATDKPLAEPSNAPTRP